MRTLTDAIKEQKNNPSGSPFVLLLDQSLPDGNTIYLAKYDIDIVFNGHTYLATQSFQIGDVKETSRGTLETISLAIVDVNRELQAKLRENGGIVGQTSMLHIVNVENLTNPADCISDGPFQVKGASWNEAAISLTLGFYNIFTRPFPRYRYERSKCRFVYESGGCGWNSDKGLNPDYPAASTATCDHTLSGPNGCRAHLNYQPGTKALRYGGFPGMPRNVQ